MSNFINSSGSGGPAQGGFGPDEYDAWQARARKRSSDDLMSYAEMYNPRTRALSQMAAAGAMGQTNIDNLNNWLTQTKQGFFAQQGARMLQGTLGGGSFVDMAYGTQQMMGNAGMRMNMGPGGNRMMFGGGMGTDIASRMIFDQLSTHYFDQRGLGVQARTMGQNPTDLARNFQILSATGQLSGLNATTFGDLTVSQRLGRSAADLSLQNRTTEAGMVRKLMQETQGMGNAAAEAKVSQAIQNANSGGYTAMGQSLQAQVIDSKKGVSITSELKDAITRGVSDLVKVHKSMTDTFGALDELQSLTMGSSLTGISLGKAGSGARIAAKLESMKGTANALGMGQQQYFQSVAGFGSMMGGFMGGTSGTDFGSIALPGLVSAQRSSTAMANLSGRLGYKGVSMQRILQEHAHDTRGVRSEMGARTATSLAYMANTNAQVLQDPSLSGEINSAITDWGNARTGGEKEAATNRLIALQNSLGGGPDLSTAAMEEKMAGTPMGALMNRALHSAVNQSVRHRYIDRARGAGRRNGAGSGYMNNAGSLLFELDYGAGKDTRMEIMAAARSGNRGEVDRLLAENEQYFRRNGKSLEDIQNLFNAAQGEGSLESLGFNLTETGVNLHTAKENINLGSAKARYGLKSAAAGEAFRRAGVVKGDSGKTTWLAAAGKALLAGGGSIDSTEKEVLEFMANSGRIRGVNKLGTAAEGNRLSMNDAQLEHWSKNAKLMEELNLRVGDKAGLAAVVGTENSMTEMVQAMGALGMRSTGITEGDTSSLAYIPAEDFTNATDAFGEHSMDAYLNSLGITGLSDEEKKALLNGGSAELGADRYKALTEKAGRKIRKDLRKNGSTAQGVKDALYSGDKMGALKALQLLKNSGDIMPEHVRTGIYNQLLGDEELRSYMGKTYQGLDTTNWEEGKEGGHKVIDDVLSRVAGSDQYRMQETGETVMSNMTVQHMTVMKSD